MGIEAGLSNVDITPPIGSTIPGSIGPFRSEGAHDPLLVNAMILSDDRHEPIALLSADALGFPPELVETMRTEVQEVTGISKDHISIAATHTHNGGPSISMYANKADAGYQQYLVDQFVKAAKRAYASQEASSIRVGRASAPKLGFNRRYFMRDGYVLTQPGKPGTPNHERIDRVAGPVDDEVMVMGVFGADGRFRGAGVNFACHPTTRVGERTRHSADYVYYLRQRVHAIYGAPSSTILFLLGACGDVTNKNNMAQAVTEYGVEGGKFIGWSLGDAVGSVLTGAVGRREASIAVVTRDITLTRRNPDKVAIDYNHMFGGQLSSGERIICEEDLEQFKEIARREPTLTAQLQAVRVGGTRFVTLPGEIFVKHGLEIKAAFPGEDVMVVTNTSGYLGYLPPSEAFVEGGYEVQPMRHGQLVESTGDMLRDQAIQMLQELDG